MKYKDKYMEYLKIGYKDIGYKNFEKYYMESNDMDFIESIYLYYEEFIYYDKYSIFDPFIDKSDLITHISNLYLYDLSCVKLIYFLRKRKTLYSKYNGNDIDSALSYLFLHIKRGNLKVRILLSLNYEYKIYTKDNADEFILEVKQKYLDAGIIEGGPESKEDFTEYWVEIALVESEWIDYSNNKN